MTTEIKTLLDFQPYRDHMARRAQVEQSLRDSTAELHAVQAGARVPSVHQAAIAVAAGQPISDVFEQKTAVDRRLASLQMKRRTLIQALALLDQQAGPLRHQASRLVIRGVLPDHRRAVRRNLSHLAQAGAANADEGRILDALQADDVAQIGLTPFLNLHNQLLLGDDNSFLHLRIREALELHYITTKEADRLRSGQGIEE